jgi:hypothetical protein
LIFAYTTVSATTLLDNALMLVVGALMTLSRIPRRWAAGLTELPGGRWLLVSRGTGMERGNAPRLRFLCRPDLVVIDLKMSSP